MKTSRLVPIAVLVSLALPAAAAAKEPVKVTVCGSSACHTTKDKETLTAIVNGGPPTNPPARGVDWYRSTLTIGGADGVHTRVSVIVVPSQNVIGSRNDSIGHKLTWLEMTPQGERAYRRLTRGLEPRPAETFSGLSDSLPEAKVSETFSPSADDGDGGGIDAWMWVLTAAVAFSVAAALWFRRRRPPRVARGGSPRPQ